MQLTNFEIFKFPVKEDHSSQGFPTEGMGGVLPPPVENSLILLLPGKIPPGRLPPNQIFILSPPKINYPVLNKNFQVIAKKSIIFSCSHCSCTIFVLIRYYFDTQVILILILMDVEYSQNAVFSFAKGLNHQNRSSSGSHHRLKNSPPQ